MEDSRSDAHHESTQSQSVNKLGCFVQDLFFLRSEKERLKLFKRYADWKIRHSKEYVRDHSRDISRERERSRTKFQQH